MTRDELKLKSIKELKAIAARMGIENIEGDRRQKSAWIWAIDSHQVSGVSNQSEPKLSQDAIAQTCSTCEGKPVYRCQRCDGSGRVENPELSPMDTVHDCPRCDGSGIIKHGQTPNPDWLTQRSCPDCGKKAISADLQTEQKLSQDAIAQEEPPLIKPFSNHSEYSEWVASNCSGCAKSTREPKCPIRESLFAATFDPDQGLTERVFEQMGGKDGACRERIPRLSNPQQLGYVNLLINVCVRFDEGFENSQQIYTLAKSYSGSSWFSGYGPNYQEENYTFESLIQAMQFIQQTKEFAFVQEAFSDRVSSKTPLTEPTIQAIRRSLKEAALLCRA